MMTGLQLPNAELLRDLLCPMGSEEELVYLCVTWSEMSRLVVGWCLVCVEKLECSVASF
jgi:hypothetical protein